MSDAAVALGRLKPRRACLEGAKQTLESVEATLRNAGSIELARTTLQGQVAERLGLLDLALRQWDQALAGEEPTLIDGAPIYICENCGRLGPIATFNDECTPGWTHGRLFKVTGTVGVPAELEAALEPHLSEDG